jgi:rhodanese-related sulfurtransferase
MKVNKVALLASSLVISMLSLSAHAEGGAKMSVKIAPDMDSVTVTHMGEKVIIQRDQDKGHTIPKLYSKTSRVCPPFCIQPASIDSSVTTIAELEMLKYLKAVSEGDKSILVIDSRTPDWAARGTIPGSVNIPWTKLNVARAGAWDEVDDAPDALDVMKDQFGVTIDDNGKMDFSGAKTLVMFCNGAWCPQSSLNIKSLLKKGYPAEKIKWYRGGMQAWVTLGLTTVPPGKDSAK